MSRLTLGQRQTLELLLKEKIARLRSEIGAALKSTGSEEHLLLANHMAEVDDQAVADLETALDIAMIERDAQELRDSVQALQRLRGPDFGTCPNCHGGISYARLLANPSVIRCVNCQEHAEQRHGRPASL